MKKVALITGSSRGMGRAEAYEFAKNGYNIILNYIKSSEKADLIKKEIESLYKVKVLSIQADLSNEKDIRRLVEESYKQFGQIDVLVNNAGIAPYSSVENKSIESMEETMKVNLYAPFLLTQLIAPRMVNRKYGKIVNISTIDVMKTYNAESMEYDASKSALISLTKTSALAYAPYVNVNCVCPGWIHTDMTEQNGEDINNYFLKKICKERFGEPEEVAKLVRFLCSDDAEFIDGEVICIDGGFKNL